jgi:hypothetical protein
MAAPFDPAHPQHQSPERRLDELAALLTAVVDCPQRRRVVRPEPKRYLPFCAIRTTAIRYTSAPLCATACNRQNKG